MPTSGRWVLPSFGHRDAVGGATEWPASNTRSESGEDLLRKERFENTSRLAVEPFADCR